MIEDSKIVKTITAKPGGKTGTYWTVTWEDDKKDNIFNADWLPLIEQSQKESRPLHFTKEKADYGKYYNIKTLELAIKEVSVLLQGGVQPEKPKDDMSKGDWAAKDKITRKSIERQKSVECAVMLCQSAQIKSDEILAYAKTFEEFIGRAL